MDIFYQALQWYQLQSGSVHGLSARAFKSRGMKISEISQKSKKNGNFQMQFMENCDI